MRSVQIIHAVLRVMLAETVRDELVERNVAAIVRAPSGPREEVRPWTPDDAARMHHLCGPVRRGEVRRADLIAHQLLDKRWTVAWMPPLLDLRYLGTSIEPPSRWSMTAGNRRHGDRWPAELP